MNIISNKDLVDNIYKFKLILSMGASLVYLERPNKEIEFEEGEDDKVKFAAG